MCVWYTQQNIIYIKHTITHHIGYDQEFKRMGECKQEENNTHFEYEIRDAFSCLRNDCRLKLLLAQTIYIYIYILYDAFTNKRNSNFEQINKQFARNGLIQFIKTENEEEERHVEQITIEHISNRTMAFCVIFDLEMAKDWKLPQ